MLIWDEVVSGFRLAPGGAQEAFGVTPDLAAFSKTVGCGLPYGAVAGKAALMDTITFREDAKFNRFQRVISQGTHGGNAAVCACGLATMKILATGKPHAHMNHIGALLRDAMNEAIKRQQVPACVYGDYSIGRIVVGLDSPEGARFDISNSLFADHTRIDAGTPPAIRGKLYLALLNHGVDSLSSGTYWLNAALTESDVGIIADGFEAALSDLKDDGLL